MESSFRKLVKSATNDKAAPPKTKYIEHILVATHTGESGVGEVFKALQYRLQDSTWTIVFKSLITVHLMVRKGSPDVTLAYLAKHENILAPSVFSDAQPQGRNIHYYLNYLSERARAYKETKIDWVRAKDSRLEKLPIDKGLLRETEVVQYQLTALLKCNVMETKPEDEITITVFKLLVLDLLSLFQALNQALINVLGHLFELSKTDTERAMDIYRTFTRQTDDVVQYLNVARQYKHFTGVEVPKFKHISINLGRQVNEYLKDPNFEIYRNQYLAELEAKGGSSTASKSVKVEFAKPSSSTNTTQPPPPTTKPETTKRSDSDLIDLFACIEQSPTPITVQPQQQPQPHPQLQTQMKMGISPWGPAPESTLQAAQQPSTPFSQSILMNQQICTAFVPAPTPANTQQCPATRQSTNPFARSSPQAAQPFGSWLDQLETIQVFPRPAQQTPWQQ